MKKTERTSSRQPRTEKKKCNDLKLEVMSGGKKKAIKLSNLKQNAIQELLTDNSKK